MLKYRVFFQSFVGTLYDAYTNNVIDVELEEDSIEEVAYCLKHWDARGELRKDLTFVILPVYKSDNNRLT